MVQLLVIVAGVAVTLYGGSLAYDRWIRPLVARRWMEKAIERVSSNDDVLPPKRAEFAVSVDADGLSIRRLLPTVVTSHFVPWSDIVRIVAFKRDLFTVDCICLLIATPAEAFELNEEMEGWESLTEALAKYLPGSIPWHECFSKVAFPAFEFNETAVFERGASPDETPKGEQT